MALINEEKTGNEGRERWSVTCKIGLEIRDVVVHGQYLNSLATKVPEAVLL